MDNSLTALLKDPLYTEIMNDHSVVGYTLIFDGEGNGTTPADTDIGTLAFKYKDELLWVNGAILGLDFNNTKREDREELALSILGNSNHPGKKVYAHMPSIIIRYLNKVVAAVAIDSTERCFILFEVCARPGFGRLAMLIAEKVVCDIRNNKYNRRYQGIDSPLPPAIMSLYCIETNENGSLHNFYRRCGYIQQTQKQSYKKNIHSGEYKDTKFNLNYSFIKEESVAEFIDRADLKIPSGNAYLSTISKDESLRKKMKPFENYIRSLAIPGENLTVQRVCVPSLAGGGKHLQPKTRK